MNILIEELRPLSLLLLALGILLCSFGINVLTVIGFILLAVAFIILLLNALRELYWWVRIVLNR